MSRTEEDFRRAIPESNNLVRVALKRYGEGAAEAEIGDLENPSFLVEQKVLRLEIAVEDAVGVAVGHPFKKLVQKALNQRRRKRAGIGAFAVRIDEFFEICVEVLEDEVKDGFALLGVHVFDAEEADDVERLREHLEEGDLAEGGWWDPFLVHFEAGFFQRHQLPRALVFRLVDFPVRPLPDLLQLLVFLHFFR